MRVLSCKLAVVGCIGWSVAILLAAERAAGAEDAVVAAEPGEAFDAAPFGVVESAADGKWYGIRWGQPRKIRRVVVEFASQPAAGHPLAGKPLAGAAEKLRVQYWHGAWNGRPDPIQAEAGAGGEGWAHMDDWTNGRWKDADARVHVDGKRLIFTFAPTAGKEFPGGKGPGVTYRKTLKVRVVSDEAMPRPVRFQTFTEAVCRPLSVRILWGAPGLSNLKIEGDDRGRLEVFNGIVRSVRPAPHSRTVVDRQMGFVLPGGQQGAIEADLVTALDPVSDRYDRTIVTVRSKYRPFSFAADQLARGQRILVDDLGVLVVRADDPVTLEGCRQQRREFPGKTVYNRVFAADEQTLARAWNDMPLKRPLYFVHGLPGNRNAIRQDPNGDISTTSVRHWFAWSRSPRDSDRKDWEGDMLTLRFGFPSADRRGGRELLDGYLPVLRTWWLEGPVYYESSTVLDKLDPKLEDIRLDDPTVLLMQVRVVNTSASTAGTAHLRLGASAQAAEKLVVEGDRVLAVSPAGVPSGARLRYLLRTGGQGRLAQAGNAVDWSLELSPGQSHELLLLIPSITLTKDEEIAALRKRDFASDRQRVCDYWRALTAQGAQIETPEPWLSDFYKAHLRHLEINCWRDLQAPRRYAHVGTFYYGVFANESAMMVSDLDRRGYHQAAEQCLQTWLDFQGTAALPGNFRSTEGLFYGAAGAEQGGYNKHHGYVMWCMAEHWRYTRDRAWMERAAPKLIKACEWVLRERQATRKLNPDGSRPLEFGFLPTGGLEDVQDYWYWLATNAATVWGLDALTDALADFGHPEAGRLQKEARAYHEDVMQGLREARILAPVVRLRDGTYVPKFPSRLYERGRSFGWLRETLEGSLFLLTYRLIPPESPESAWILKDYEDNLYISERYGYAIPAFDDFWFSRGGFSMQANLLDSPIPYLHRDEVKHFLRAYFNAFASAFYPEIRMCNEHSLPELGYPRGDHFKTSDEAQSTYWLRLMFVHEQGQDLYLGQAIPRYWLKHGTSVGIKHAATYFGPLSLRITSKARDGEIRATLVPPERNPPQRIYLRLRHPQAKPIRAVTLNGREYGRFDTRREWIVLPGTLKGIQEVVARY
jgi:hypothetical protein